MLQYLQPVQCVLIACCRSICSRWRAFRSEAIQISSSSTVVPLPSSLITRFFGWLSSRRGILGRFALRRRSYGRGKCNIAALLSANSFAIIEEQVHPSELFPKRLRCEVNHVVAVEEDGTVAIFPRSHHEQISIVLGSEDSKGLQLAGAEFCSLQVASAFRELFGDQGALKGCKVSFCIQY